MPRSSHRPEAARSPEGKGPKDAFNRVFEMLQVRSEGKITVREARDRFSDMVRLAGRARSLERKLGGRGVAELSPYLQAVLRLATESNIVEPAQLRRAASF